MESNIDPLINNSVSFVTSSSFSLGSILLISSVATMGFSFILWKRMKNNESAKGEFISMIAHKLRNPLTQIKWASENLATLSKNEEQNEQIKYIQNANEKIVELTDLLVTVSGTGKEELIYRYENMDISLIAKEVIKTVVGQTDSKKVNVVENISPDLMAKIDTPRIRFIMQTFIENAIHYGGDEPLLKISCLKQGNFVVFSVTDNGIGITKEEHSMLFHKFYRGKEAKMADTEGMGIGLYMAKDIIDRHGGKIGAESKGSNTGSTFYFSIPISKNRHI